MSVYCSKNTKKSQRHKDIPRYEQIFDVFHEIRNILKMKVIAQVSQKLAARIWLRDNFRNDSKNWDENSDNVKTKNA